MNLSLDGSASETTSLQALYSSLTKEVQSTQDNFQDVTRRIKTVNSLNQDRQADIESLQNEVTLQKDKYDCKLKSLEEALNTFKINQQQCVSDLHCELQDKNDIITKFENELKKVQGKQLSENNDETSLPIQGDLEELQNENETLQDEYNSLLDVLQEAEKLFITEKEKLESMTQELHLLRESLQVTKVELRDKLELVEVLNEQLLEANMDMISMSPNATNQIKSSIIGGASIFSEVDEKRVDVQKTVDSMKTDYVRLVQEQGRQGKKISHLKSQIVSLKELYKTSLEKLEESQRFIRDTLKAQLKLLKELSRQNKKKFLEQDVNANDHTYMTTYALFQAAIKETESEVVCLEKKLSDLFFSQNHCSSSLAQLKIEIERLLLAINQLESQRNKKNVKCVQETADDSYSPSTSPSTENCAKSILCIRTVNDIIRGEEDSDFRKLSGVTLRNKKCKENNYADESAVVPGKKMVKFEESSIRAEQSSKQSRVQSRGRKVFVFPKKV